jgi:signal transduction histidine kinase
MNRLLRNRLLLQLLFTLVAAVSLVALSVLLISEAIRSAQSVLLNEAEQTVATAIGDMQLQYGYRVNSDSSWSSLPEPARNVSLRGITQTVLRPYSGVEGGFYTPPAFLGYAFPTGDSSGPKIDVPQAARQWVLDTVQRSLATGSMQQQVIRGNAGLLVIESRPDADHATAIWAMKRLAANRPGFHQRELLLAGLVLAALLSIVGILTTGIGLQRGVTQVKQGLAKLESDFVYRLPPRSDELGEISKSINRMATVRGHLETELRREDRLRALGRLASGLAHEIRNPLNSIRLTIQLLEQRLRTGAIRGEDLQLVKDEIDRMNTLLTDLLDLQRVRVPRPDRQELEPVVQRCLDLIERQAAMQRSRVELLAFERGLSAFFDAQSLTQALVNLLLNALEASGEGGLVEVRIVREDGAVHLEVQDDGPGLTAEQQEHLFEAFYTTKTDGTGLGLAVSRELMRGQGGDLLFRAGGSGATFVIRLAKDRASLAEDAAMRLPERAVPSALRIS